MSHRPDESARTTVYALLAFGMILFGSATPISKIVTGAMPVLVGSLIRVGIGALVLLPVVASRWEEIRRFDRRDWGLVALISLFGMFGFTVFMLYGMRLVSGVVGAVVMSTTPAVTAAAAMLLMGESRTWRKLAAIALAVMGVLILQLGSSGGGGGQGGGQGGAFLFGALLVFAAVCCEAAYTLLGKVVSEETDPVLVAFLAAVLSLPIFLVASIWQWGDFAPAQVGWRAWAAVAWYGAGTLALGTWLWYSGVARAQGSIAAGFMGLMPVSALVLSYVLLGEPVRWIHLAGFAVVFAGVLLISWEHARMSRGR